jgi:predicted GIY-YIG superfamily endonuclease
MELAIPDSITRQIALIVQARQALEEARPIPFAERRNLPTYPGIYIVEREGAVLYIGQSINLRKRWSQHHRTRQFLALDGLTIRFAEVATEILAGLERELIIELRPRFNGTDLPPTRPCQIRPEYWERRYQESSQSSPLAALHASLDHLLGWENGDPFSFLTRRRASGTP